MDPFSFWMIQAKVEDYKQMVSAAVQKRKFVRERQNVSYFERLIHLVRSHSKVAMNPDRCYHNIRSFTKTLEKADG